MRLLPRPLLPVFAAVVIFISAAPLAYTQSGIYINGKPLDENEKQIIQLLEQKFQTKCQPGRYWYDAYTGLFGFEGQPSNAVIAPHLPLGGRLKANASGGGDGRLSGTFLNGRELHPYDVQRLSVCAPVQKGRFWMDAVGNTGFEGGPALGNVVVICQAALQARAAQQRAAQQQASANSGSPSGNNNGPRRSKALGTPGNRGWYGSVHGDGNTVGAIFSDGTSVSCGPDGGCIY